MTRTLSLAALLSLGLLACSDKGDDSAAGTDGTDGTDATDSTDGTGDGTDGTEPVTFSIAGTAVMFDNFTQPAAEGLCVEILDPTNVLGGGDPVVVSETTVGADGAWQADGVPVVSLGLFAQVKDCGAEGTTFPSANGISSGSYADVSTGDVVSGVTALTISAELAGVMQTELTAAGFAADEAAGVTGNIAEDGLVVGFIWDINSAPINDATMTCGSCVVYYADGDPADGLFTTGGAANTGTSVDGNGLFAVPAAQLTTYQPAAPGGYEFTSTPLAALPASAVIVAFTAENM